MITLISKGNERRVLRGAMMVNYSQTTETADSHRLSVDAVCDLLADEHRRAFLGYLIEAPEAYVNLDDALDAIWQGNRPRRSLRMDMTHRHLPKLENVDVVEYDDHSGDVVYYGDPLLEEFLEISNRLSQ